MVKSFQLVVFINGVFIYYRDLCKEKFEYLKKDDIDDPHTSSDELRNSCNLQYMYVCFTCKELIC